MSTATDTVRTLLLDSARRLFVDGIEEGVQEAVEQGQWPAALWQAIEDNGLPLALVPETRGGVGLSLRDATAVVRLAGAFALPLPLAETMTAQWLVTSAGLPPLEGPAAVAPSSFGRHLALREADDGLVLEGATGPVAWGREESALVLVANAEHLASGAALVVLPRPPAGGVPVDTPIGEPVTSWSLSALGVPADSIAELPVGFTAETAIALGALLRVALVAGALERVLDLTIEHAREREQFGRPIARFQAVQQAIARLAGLSAAAGAALEAATAGVGDVPAGNLAETIEIAAAKARASTVVAEACAIAHQIHAAIGFTREHALHRFTRRLWTWRDQYGTESDWWERVGEAALRAGGDGLWGLISGT